MCQKALRRVVGVLPDLAAADLVLLRYKPGRRMVARLDLQGQPRGVLKVIAGRAFDGALIGATAAMADGQAPLLGADAALGAMLTAWIPGYPVCPEITSHAPNRTTVARIGAVLAALHANPFRPATEWTAQADAEDVLTVAADLMPLDADLATRAQALATPLAARLAGTAFDPVLVHGDFSADQVVIGNGGPVILDWDNAGLGDPARDVGSFLARMDAQVIDGLLTQDQADDRGAALLQGYGTVPASVVLHHARALMLLLTEGFRNRHPDWSARTQKMMVRIEQVLGTMTTHHASGMRGS